jgi:hypothetical protein
MLKVREKVISQTQMGIIQVGVQHFAVHPSFDLLGPDRIGGRESVVNE